MKIAFLILAVAALVLVTPSEGRSQDASADSTQAEPRMKERSSRLFPPRLAAGGLVYLPKAYHSSETGFGLGGQLLYPFLLGSTEGESDVRVKGRYTVKNQGLLELETTLRWVRNWSVKAKLMYDSLPQRFWGLGANTSSDAEEVYQPQRLRGYVEVFRRVHRHLRVGARFEVEDHQVLHREPIGILQTRPPPGIDRGLVSGAGLLVDVDTRDNRYAPTRGIFIEMFGLNFDDSLGSDFDFNLYNIEFRHFRSMREGYVWASQAFVYSARGEPPFWRYAALGGRHHSRGYRKGRYLDRVVVAFQGELRADVWSRVGLVGFGGLASAAPSFDAVRLDRMRPTVGGGLRLQVSSREDILVRADVAAGQTSLRFYFSLGQAF